MRFLPWLRGKFKRIKALLKKCSLECDGIDLMPFECDGFENGCLKTDVKICAKTGIRIYVKNADEKLRRKRCLHKIFGYLKTMD